MQLEALTDENWQLTRKLENALGKIEVVCCNATYSSLFILQLESLSNTTFLLLGSLNDAAKCLYNMLIHPQV